MPARDIVYYPDTRLKTSCAFVSDLGLAQTVARDLLDTMDACPPRTVGIAAPQIGELVRVAIVDTSRNPKYPAGHGLLTLINPKLVEHSGSQFFREGCLSLPDYTANIQRYEHIVIDAFDVDLNEVTVEADGFEAVVIQHEMDHLDGILFLDRIANMATDLFPRKRK